MADRRVTEDTTITAASTAAGDWFDLVDVSDTTDAPSGTNKKIAASEVATLVGTLLNIAATYQPLDSDLTAIAALTTTSFGRALLTQADAAATRTTIGAAGTTDLAAYLPLLAGGASVENIGAVESNVSTVASSGASQTLDTSVFGVFDVTMSANCTFTFSNPAPSGKNSTFMLVLRGAFTPTLPASVKWADATAPTYGTPSVYVFTTNDAGTNWLGQRVGKAFG